MKTSEPASLQVGLSTTLSSDMASGLADLFEDGEVGGQEDWLFLSASEEDGRLDEALTDGKFNDIDPAPGIDWLGRRKANSPFGKRLGITESPVNILPLVGVGEELLLLMSPFDGREAGTIPTVDIPAGIWTLRDCNMLGKLFPKLRLVA